MNLTDITKVAKIKAPLFAPSPAATSLPWKRSLHGDDINDLRDGLADFRGAGRRAREPREGDPRHRGQWRNGAVRSWWTGSSPRYRRPAPADAAASRA